MSVTDSGDVLTGSAIFHGQSSFIDHLSCPLQDSTQNSRSECYRFKQLELEHSHICFCLMNVGYLA